MASDDPVFKTLSDFGTVDILRPTRGIDNSTTSGPTTSAALAALASSNVARSVVELETQLIDLKKQLAQPK